MRISLKIFVSIIGTLLFLSSLVALYFAFDKEETAPLLLVALANITAVFTLFFLITQGILPSLELIQKILRRVGRGDFSARVNTQKGSPEELQVLADTVNTMIARIQKAREEIEEEKAQLESTVQERTIELQELADTLEDKVRDRTRELQEKIKELERFQRVAVGRELKMIALKKDIERLASQFEARDKKTVKPSGK